MEAVCTCHNHERPIDSIAIYNRTYDYDPTRTLTLRRTFARDITRRFRALAGAIRRSIVDNDCFGLKGTVNIGTIPVAAPNKFAFPNEEDKVDAFMDWLSEMEQRYILSAGEEGFEVLHKPRFAGTALDKRWTDVYIRSAYQKGIQRGRQELINSGYPVSPLDETGGVVSAFNQPVHADRAGVLYTRTFRDLKDITNAMDTQISHILTAGIMDGKNPLQLAREINKNVKGMPLTKSRTLARTEIIRAHHRATVQEYRNAQAQGVKVKAEWSTAGDSRVCAICAGLEGKEYTLDEVEGMIPAHPNCRCIALPLDVTDRKE